MKKSTILFLAIFFGFSSFSQSQKGDFTLSTNLSTLGWAGGLGFTGGVGIRSDYRVTNRIAIGVETNYSSNFYSSNTLRFGVFSRYYFKNDVFVGMGLNRSNTTFTTRDLHTKQHGMEYFIEVGKRYDLSKRFYIEPSLSHGWGLGSSNRSRRSAFNLGLGFKF